MSEKPIRRRVKWDDDAHKRSMEKKRKLPENTIYAEWGRLDVRRDMLLLGTMFWMGLDHLSLLNADSGMELSVEIPNNVMRALQVMMKNVPADERGILGRVLHRDAELCLKSSCASDGRGAVLAVAHLIVKLTDEGLIPDPASNIVIAALAVVSEAADDGLEGAWRYLEHEVVLQSQRLWERAQLAGYLQTMVPTVKPVPTRPK